MARNVWFQRLLWRWTANEISCCEFTVNLFVTPIINLAKNGCPFVTAGFLYVTEIEGQQISQEQLERMCHRYYWAAEVCEGRDVLEVACGAGQGLEILRRKARSLKAGDYSPEVLEVAKKNFGTSVPLSVFGAEDIPFADASLDCVLLFEALYYINPAEAFFAEAARVLRTGGSLLIATANKDLYDFHPSPFANRYLGVRELSHDLALAGFTTEMWGYLDTRQVSMRQQILRPVKALASKMGLIPKTMRGKEYLKKLFFGEMALMPASLADVPFTYSPPIPITANTEDRAHKVIYCRATKI